MSDTQSIDGRDTDRRKGDISKYMSDSDLDKTDSEDEKPTHRSTRSHTDRQTRRQKGQDKRLGTRAQPNRRPEPSSRWNDLQLFDEDKPTNTRGASRKESKSHSLSSRRASQKRSVGARPPAELSESSTESEEEDDRVLDGKVNVADLPTEYWQIQRLMKYLKMGNQTASVIALCGLRDLNLSAEVSQMAIRDINGLTLLVNLLRTSDERCKIGSLKILQPLTDNSKYNRLTIIGLGAVQTLLGLVTDGTRQVQGLSAATLANMVKSSRGRNAMRRRAGVRKLVALLDIPECPSRRSARTDPLQQEQRILDLEVARCAALALWSCSRSTRSRASIYRAGAVPLLAKLIRQNREELLEPVVGLVQECAVEERYRQAFYKEAIMGDIVRHLKTENEDLLIYCVSAIFKCAEDHVTRCVVREHGGLEVLVSLLRRCDNAKLLAAVTGAIWKCAISDENVKRFMKLNVLESLVKILQSADDDTPLPEQVQVNIVGALAELCKESAGRRELLRCHGCALLVDLLKIPNQQLVAAAALAVAACAVDPECRRKINELDGLRLLWTLLKSNKPQVISSAAWGICRLLEDTPEACETAREFVGGLELLINHLKAEDVEVVSSACAAVSNLSTDLENVAVMSDYGVVGCLAGLTHRTETILRRHLAEAISRRWGRNASEFCRHGVVQRMVEYLGADDVIVKRSAMRALEQLGRTPDSCIEMHRNGVVKLLVQMVGSEDEALQEAAAGCLSNIRCLAMANEKARQEAKQ